MTHQPDMSVDHVTWKIATAWLASLFTSWADVASFLAAVYSLCLIGEWLYKKFVPRKKRTRDYDRG